MKNELYKIASIAIFALLMTYSGAHAVDIGKYEVYEYAISHTYSGSNPWQDVTIDVEMLDPASKKYTFGGFYYSPNTWKVRFSPNKTGTWRWRYRINAGTWSSYISYTCVASARKGFITQSPNNPTRWIYSESGEAFYAHGWQDCINNDLNGNAWALSDHGGVSLGEYLDAFAENGFNLYRLNHANCSPVIFGGYAEGNNGIYKQEEGIFFDRFCKALHERNIKIMLVPFNKMPDSPLWSNAAYEKYAKYLVNRWGAYVDFWEISNEDGNGIDFGRPFVDALDVYDYYHRAWAPNASIDSEGKTLQGYGFASRHRYAYVNHHYEYLSKKGDLSQILLNPETNQLPYMVTEVGHKDYAYKPGWERTWPAAAYIMYFNEMQAVYWHTAWKDYSRARCCSNLSITDEMFEYFGYFLAFVQTVDDDRLVKTSISNSWDPFKLLTYGLSGPDRQLVLVLNNTTETRNNEHITINTPRAGTGAWYDIYTGKMVKGNVAIGGAGTHQVAIPPLKSDDMHYVYYLKYNNMPCLAGSPSAPSGLNAHVLSKDAVELTWSDNSGVEEGYMIERKTGSGSYEQVAFVWNNVERFVDRKVAPGTTNTYRIKGTSCAGESGYSNTVTVTSPLYNDEIVKMNRVDPISPGQTVTIPVEYEASATRELVLDLKKGSEPWTTYASVKVTVNVGHGTKNIALTVPANLPIANDAYRWALYMIPSGGNWSQRFDDSNESDIDCVVGGQTLDVVSAVERVNPVIAGNTYTVTVNYTATAARDLRLEFKLDSEPWTVYTGKTIRVNEGAGSVDFSMTVPAGVQAAEYAYQWLAFIMPAGGTWADRYDEFREGGIDCIVPAGNKITLEAEDASGQAGFAPWSVSGAYIVVPQGTGIANNNAVTDSDGKAQYFYNLSVATNVTVEALVRFPSLGDDSFWHRMDNGSWAAQNLTAYPEWTWITLKTYNSMAAGQHTFQIARREDGAQIDKFRLTAANGEISSGSVLQDKLTSIERIDPVMQGQTYTLSIGYEASTARDIELSFKLDSDPWTTYVAKKVDVSAGTGTVNISITVPSTVPVVDDAYMFVANLLPDGGSWDNRLDNIKQEHIDCEAASCTVGTPSAPSGLSATATATSSVSLTWNDNSSVEDNYYVEQKVSGGSYTQVKTLGANTSSTTITGLNAGTQYYFRVRGMSCAGYGSYSNEANATTQSNASSAITVEAEGASGQSSFAPWTVSSGLIVVPGGTGIANSGSVTASDGKATYQFSLSQSSNVTVEAYVKFPDLGSDSFWHRIDAGTWTVQNLSAYPSLTWITLKTYSSLSAGNHQLEIARREDRAGIDKFRLTASSGTISAGTGAARLAVMGTSPEDKSQNDITLYPNPANTTLYIQGLEANASVIIIDMTGRSYSTFRSENQIDLSHLREGVYAVSIKSAGLEQIEKLVIKR
ncbi:MAG: DUF5060 domain-containing protein [Cyclobacteriaceae bacterium]|nr:DUF5060 domain-containing protein [Cyclobacteriaceae bacterium]